MSNSKFQLSSERSRCFPQISLPRKPSYLQGQPMLNTDSPDKNHSVYRCIDGVSIVVRCLVGHGKRARGLGVKHRPIARLIMYLAGNECPTCGCFLNDVAVRAREGAHPKVYTPGKKLCRGEEDDFRFR